MSNTPSDDDATTRPVSLFSAANLLLFCKGVAMGMGDAVPGISGGTIAVISNIYDKLIYSIRAIDIEAARQLLNGRFREFWTHINGYFLLILALGMLTGLLLSANTVLYLLDTQFESLMAFFIGLVLASAVLLLSQFRLRSGSNIFVFLLGMLAIFAIGTIEPGNSELSYFTVFLSGALAICAMILPGLSGAFILILLGVYDFMLSALMAFNYPYILAFTLGCIVGLLAFSRLLSWLLQHYHQLCYGFITGLLLGSISVLWPWQQAVTFHTDSAGQLHALQTVKLWPSNYSALTGDDPMLLATMLSLLAGLLLVTILHKVFKNSSDIKGKPGSNPADTTTPTSNTTTS